METLQKLVTQFHITYGAPVAIVPQMITRKRYDLRKSLIEEELVEYMVAYEKGDIVEIADALGDLLYVVMGTAVEHGIDMSDIVQEIHRSNMSKLGVDGLPIYREDGKVVKGPNFSPPDLASIIRLERVKRCSMCAHDDHWCDQCDAHLDHDGNELVAGAVIAKHVHE